MSAPGRTPAKRVDLLWPAKGARHSDCGYDLIPHPAGVIACPQCKMRWNPARLARMTDERLADTFHVAPLLEAPSTAPRWQLVEVDDRVNRVRYLSLRPVGLPLGPDMVPAEVTL